MCVVHVTSCACPVHVLCNTESVSVSLSHLLPHPHPHPHPSHHTSTHTTHTAATHMIHSPCHPPNSMCHRIGMMRQRRTPTHRNRHRHRHRRRHRHSHRHMTRVMPSMDMRMMHSMMQKPNPRRMTHIKHHMHMTWTRMRTLHTNSLTSHHPHMSTHLHPHHHTHRIMTRHTHPIPALKNHKISRFNIHSTRHGKLHLRTPHIKIHTYNNTLLQQQQRSGATRAQMMSHFESRQHLCDA